MRNLEFLDILFRQFRCHFVAQEEEGFELLRTGNDSLVGVSRGRDAPSHVDHAFRPHLLEEVEGAEEKSRLLDAVETMDQNISFRGLTKREKN